MSETTTTNKVINIKRILVATKSPFSDKANEALRQIAEQNGIQADVVIKREINEFVTDDALKKKLEQANALIIRSDKITPEIIDGAKSLEIVIRGGAGYDNVDVDYCSGKGITVMNTPGQNSNGVAELVFYIAGCLLRKINLVDSTTKSGLFEKSRFKGKELRDKKIGIMGFGYIGQIVAEIANGFGMKVYAYDPFVNPTAAKDKNALLVNTPEELFKDSYMVSLHLPKSKNTIGIINKKLLELMKPNGILINTARAEVINEDDLDKHLAETKSFMYGADVHAGGDKPGEKRFAKFNERVVLTPHIGAGTDEANYNCAIAAANQAIGFFLKGDMTYSVNKDVVPPWLRDYAVLAEKLGYINSQLIKQQCPAGHIKQMLLVAYDELQEYLNPLAGNVLKGMFNDTELKPTDALKHAENNQIILDLRKPAKKKA